MNRSFRTLRRLTGTTLTEVTISSALLIGMLSFGIPVFRSIGDAGEDGSSKLSAQSQNQVALLKIAGELQNSSTIATDPVGVPRLSINVGTAPQPLVDQRQGAAVLGGFQGVLGAKDPGHADPTSSNSGSLVKDDGGTTNTNTTGSFGSGEHSLTQFGRVRQASRGTADKIDGVAMRPRYKDIALNSELVFQKVVGYTVGADGAPEVIWGSPITYRVGGNRKLQRVQDGDVRPVATHVVGFRAELTDSGTVLLTLVTQKLSGGTGRVAYQANQVEIGPKN